MIDKPIAQMTYIEKLALVIECWQSGMKIQAWVPELDCILGTPPERKWQKPRGVIF